MNLATRSLLALSLLGCAEPEVGVPPPTNPATVPSPTSSTPTPTPPSTGSLTVRITTSGMQLDPDGYALIVDAPALRQAVGVNDDVELTDLLLGDLTVSLGEVAPNCDVGEGPEREVTVTDTAAEVRFDVTCVPAVGADTLVYVAFDRAFGGYNPKFLSVDDGTDGLLFEELEVYRNIGPAVSPDGRWVALSITDEQDVDRLWVMRVDGSEAREIDAPAVHPTWSPDGTQLAYMFEDVDFWRLRTRDVAAQTEPFTVTSQNWAVHPQWSPSGDEIAYIVGESIQAVTPDGQDYRTILRSEPDVYLGPTLSWSPDGARLAYTRLDPDDSGFDVHVISAEGTDDVAVYESERYDEWPVFSPDGQEVALVHRVYRDVLEIWAAPADGVGEPRLVRTESGYTTLHGQGWGRVELPPQPGSGTQR